MTITKLNDLVKGPSFLYDKSKDKTEAKKFIGRQIKIIERYNAGIDFNFYLQKSKGPFSCEVENAIVELKNNRMLPKPSAKVVAQTVKTSIQTNNGTTDETWDQFFKIGRLELQKLQNSEHPSLFLWLISYETDSPIWKQMVAERGHSITARITTYQKIKKENNLDQQTKLEAFFYQNLGDRVILKILRQKNTAGMLKFCSDLMYGVMGLKNKHKLVLENGKHRHCGIVFYYLARQSFRKLIDQSFQQLLKDEGAWAYQQWHYKLQEQEGLSRDVFNLYLEKQSIFSDNSPVNWEKDHIQNIEKLVGQESIFFYFANKMFNDKNWKAVIPGNKIIKSLKDYINSLKKDDGLKTIQARRQKFLTTLKSKFPDNYETPYRKALSNEAEFVLDYFRNKNTGVFDLPDERKKEMPTSMRFLYYYAEQAFEQKQAPKPPPGNGW